MFPGSQITGLDRPSCLEDLIRRLRVLLHPVPLPLLMEGGGSNECWLNLALGMSEKKKKDPSLLCDSITSENFYSLGDLFIRSWWIQFVRDVRDSDGTRAMLLWREDTVVEGSQAAGGSGRKSFLSRWHEGHEQREGKENAPGHKEGKGSGEQGAAGLWKEQGRREARDCTATGTAMLRCSL